MPKLNLTPEDKAKLIEAINNDTEPTADMLPKLFPGTAEKFDVQALDRAKIPTLEYAGKRSKAAILAEAGAGIGAAPLQTVRCFGEIKKDEWCNLIVQGDNLQFLKTCYNNTEPLIKDKVKGKVKLIYIDPPFATESDFQSSDGADSYRDKVVRAEFIESLRERLIYLKTLLKDDGAIYLHLDSKMHHYMKVIMDDIFDKGNFRNEIFVRRIKKNIKERKLVPSLNDAVDIILFYTTCKQHLIDPSLKYSPKLERWHGFDAPGYRKGMDYMLFGIKPEPNRHWMWEEDKAKKAIKEGRLRPHKNTGKPEYLIEASDFDIRDSLWDDITGSAFTTGYPTEKKEDLLRLIIQQSSNVGDLILDCFAGSGTAAAVAEKLGRRWIACDFGKHSIYTIQKRLINISESKITQDSITEVEIKRCNDCNSPIEENECFKRCNQCQTIIERNTKKKAVRYGKPPKPFCVVSSGAYDFSHIMDLRKHKETYVDFVLGLFQLTRNEEKAKRFKLANIYAVKDNNPVEVYPVWDDEFLKEIKIDKSYLQDIISQSGGKLKGEYYIITPESCTNISDTILKNQDGKDVQFFIKTFPYKVLEDISRNFELQEQPCSQDNVNNLITSTAFYFNEDVILEAERTKNGLRITKFESKILDKEGHRFEGFSGLAMLLVDLDYEQDKPFDMDKTVFAKEIDEDGSVKIDGLTESVGLIAIDKHGNESKPISLE